ncbi:MAG: hypothetical protein IPL33_05225 [Sphingobacteriales bacterium]|nr:hypothetical protein [Sphingobacteriales bacterium]
MANCMAYDPLSMGNNGNSLPVGSLPRYAARTTASTSLLRSCTTNGTCLMPKLAKRRTDTMSLPYFYNDSPHTFDTSLYADAAGKGLFAQLPADTYYVYARAYDHIWGDSVAGGKTVVVPQRDSLLQIIVAVSE